MGSKGTRSIVYDNAFARRSNNAGGIEGGMSNGEPIVVRAAMKPIPTLYRPLASVDLRDKSKVEASVERSDILRRACVRRRVRPLSRLSWLRL